MAVSYCPMETKMDAGVSVVTSFEGDENQWPVFRVQVELPIGPSHIC